MKTFSFVNSSWVVKEKELASIIVFIFEIRHVLARNVKFNVLVQNVLLSWECFEEKVFFSVVSQKLDYTLEFGS